MSSARTGKHRKISVHSLDFDGCIFNQRFYDLMKGFFSKKKRAVEANQEFIDKIIKKLEEESADEAIFMVGSARQSKSSDAGCNKSSNNNDDSNVDLYSCFPVLNRLGKAIAKLTKIPCYIERFLLADIYGDKPGGESFTKALEKSKDYQHSQWFWDDSKLTILYAQMHKLASEHPDDEIIYNFYDDRTHILQPLHEFFKANKDLIPKNITLCLHHYEGENITDYEPIKPQENSKIDYNYRANIKRMVECAGYDLNKPLELRWRQSQYVVLENLNLEGRLANFKATRDTDAKVENYPSSKILIPVSKQLEPTKDEKSIDLVNVNEQVDEIVKKAILDYVADYILSRSDIVVVTDIKDEDLSHKVEINENKKLEKALLLNWTSRHFRDPILTKQKVELAARFYSEIKKETSYAEIKKKITAFKQANQQLEKNNKKKYLFAYSGLDDMIFEIDYLLKSARPPRLHN